MYRKALVLAVVLVLVACVSGPVRADDLQDIVFAGLNTAGQEGVVESSITFLADANMDAILKHMFDSGTLNKIAPDHIKVTKVEKTSETADAIEYKVDEELKPLINVPFVTSRMEPTKVHLIFTVNKRALADRTVAVKYELDPKQENGWEVLSGRIYAVDLRNGHTMVMLASSTKSRYGMPSTIRLKLAKLYLEKTKTHIVNWLGSLQ